MFNSLMSVYKGSKFKFVDGIVFDLASIHDRFLRVSFNGAAVGVYKFDPVDQGRIEAKTKVALPSFVPVSAGIMRGKSPILVEVFFGDGKYRFVWHAEKEVGGARLLDRVRTIELGTGIKIFEQDR